LVELDRVQFSVDYVKRSDPGVCLYIPGVFTDLESREESEKSPEILLMVREN